MRPLWWFGFLAGSALAQSPAAPAFEVASVKVNELYRQDDRMTWRQSIESSHGNLTMRNVNMRMMVAWAWDVQRPLVTGPDWIDGGRFDVVAKAGREAEQDEVRQMLRTLLADRFKLEVHRETRTLDMMALLPPKGPHKMKESEITTGPMQNSQNPGGGATVKGAFLKELCNEVSREVNMPVVDLTGLKGRFDFTFNPNKYRQEMISRLQASPPAQRPSEQELVMTVTQDLMLGELGLRLERRRSPLDMVVIDRGEKAPAAN